MSSGFDVPTTQEILYRSRLNCEARGPNCKGRGHWLHHRKLRRHGDHSTINGLHVCDPCHVPTIHAYPGWAYRHGLLVHAWDNPATIPVHPGCPLDCETDHVGVDG